MQRSISLRHLARTIEVQPSYVSKVERGEVAPPSEKTIRRWADAINEDPDVLLAMAGKVSSDLQDSIMRRPVLFARLIRELKDLPDHAVLRIVREVRAARGNATRRYHMIELKRDRLEFSFPEVHPAARITGAVSPTQPPSAADYTKAGLPWFDWYDEHPTIGGTEALRRLRSVGQAGDSGDRVREWD